MVLCWTKPTMRSWQSALRVFTAICYEGTFGNGLMMTSGGIFGIICESVVDAILVS